MTEPLRSAHDDGDDITISPTIAACRSRGSALSTTDETMRNDKGSRKKTPRTVAAPPAPAPPVPAPVPAPRVSAGAVPRAWSPPRPPAPPAAPAPRPFFAPAIQRAAEEETEHRSFPRAPLATPVELWIEEAGARRFTATLRSLNVSVGGAFLESTFFLPLDTLLRVRFRLEPGGPAVEAHARIVREQRSAGEGEPSGFGIRFEEFQGQTEVALARLFLDSRLRAFAEEYLRSPRARGLSNELERVVDALAAWELQKAHSSTRDTWGSGD